MPDFYGDTFSKTSFQKGTESMPQDNPSGSRHRPTPGYSRRQPYRLCHRRSRLYGMASLWLLLLISCTSARSHKLVEELSNPLPTRRSEVYKELDKLGPRARPALLEGLGHMDPLIRESIQQYLLQHQGEQAIPLLLEALKHPSEQVRLNGIQVLGKLAPKGASRVIPALQEARNDPQSWVRDAAYKALGRYGAIKATTLFEALKDPSTAIRLRAAIQLARQAPRGGTPVKQALETLMLDPNPRLKQVAFQGLKRFGLTTVVGPIAPRLQQKLSLKEYLFHYGKRGAGQLNQAQLQRVIQGNWPAIKRCHKQHSGSHSLEGKLIVRWVIYKTGDVLATSIVYNTIAYTPFVHCLMLQVRTWQFPSSPDGGLIVASYPFVVQSQARE